ncbi:MAG TPA: septal ring lytic transglycosylase RlpA family protein [Acidimicrobiales bacterium]|nr:septal ring lytic transglycosylase RlpA family protein [Acidimicrobiales bacterium]
MPQTPIVGAISLQELARQVKAKSTTSTTKARSATTTTAKRATAATTTTKPAPAPAKTTTTVAGIAPPGPVSATTTTVVLSPLPTIVQAVVPPAVAVAGAVTRTDSGVASWFHAPDGTCAHRTLPMGTLIKVTRIHNGAVASCKVNDRGPTVETGRLIDLSDDTFEKLAAKEAGLIDVRIEW